MESFISFVLYFSTTIKLLTNTVDGNHCYALESIEVGYGCYLWWCRTKHIEAMIVPFRVWNLANTRPFKKVCTNCSSRNLSILIKLDLYEFTKTTEDSTCDHVRFVEVRNIASKAKRVSFNWNSYLELLFFTVLALPNASKTGLD